MEKFEQRELINGVKMPVVGFGTDMTFSFLRKNVIGGMKFLLNDIFKNNKYYYKRDRSIMKIVKNAPKEGCHLFDTASAYGQSERVLGQCLKKYNREDYFIITKLSNKEQRAGNVEVALRKSMKKLKVDKLDLYLMHWPQTGTYIDCWKQMEQLYEKGLVGAIGVCNFKPHHFEELKKHAQIMPMVNQVECHPLFTQNETYEYCTENNIQMMAYTPTGRMDKRLRESNILKEIAGNYDKSIAQIIIRWHYQRGIIPIINTTNLEHLKENSAIFDFELTQEDMAKISGLNIDCRLRYDPDTVDFTKC